MQYLSTLATLVAAVSAYQVLTPTLNSTIAKGSTIDVRYTSVDTDADTFSVYLTNFQTAHWPPTVLSLAQNVRRDAGSVSVRIPCDVTSDYGWQLNFINGTNTYVIYAQSPKFTLTGECKDPAPAPVPNFTNTSGISITTTIITQVIIPQPLLWFVQPSAGGNGGVCPAPVTVTVQAPAVVCTPVVPNVHPNGGGQIAILTAPTPKIAILTAPTPQIAILTAPTPNGGGQIAILTAPTPSVSGASNTVGALPRYTLPVANKNGASAVAFGAGAGAVALAALLL